jgi:deoxyadenosine/deoxycytidine kinase
LADSSSLATLVVEGPLGSGKTELAGLLAGAMNGRLILEKPGDNPFLPLFHRNMKKWAFQTQIAFMLQRYERLEELSRADLFHGLTVSDFCFHRDMIHARATLSEPEFDLYRKLFEALSPVAPNPDLIVYLQATPGFLAERLLRQGRAFERDVSRSWLEKLVESYNSYFLRERHFPTLVVSAERSLNEPRALSALVERIRNHSGGLSSFAPVFERFL